MAYHFSPPTKRFVLGFSTMFHLLQKKPAVYNQERLQIIFGQNLEIPVIVKEQTKRTKNVTSIVYRSVDIAFFDYISYQGYLRTFAL